MISLSAKTKGGAGHQMGEKRNFLGRQKFLADGVAGGSKFGRIIKNVGLAVIFNDFLFESKTKKLWYFKVGEFEISEKHGCPL